MCSTILYSECCAGAADISISESHLVGTTLPVSVTVTDADSHQYGLVSCEVEPAIFLHIANCTVIHLVTAVDYEEIQFIEATINAKDNGSPPLRRYCTPVSCKGEQLYITKRVFCEL